MPKESLLSSMPKLILAVVLIICIGAAMGLMGLMMTKPKISFAPYDEIEKETTEEKTDEETIKDETTDWQTYRNSDLDTSDWLIYNSLSTAGGYYAYYKIKYPRDWYYDRRTYKPIYSNNIKPLHAVFFDKKGQVGQLNYQIEVLAEKDKNLLFNTDDYSVRKVKIGKKDFEEMKNKKYNLKTFIYKTDYSDSISDNYYIVFRLFDADADNCEMLIASLRTLQFLGNDKRDVVIGTDEESWKKIFKSEERGFQIKYPNGYSVVNNLNDLSLVFVDNSGMYGNISVILARLSGITTAEQWLEREATINKNVSQKSEWEYYRVGDSNEIGVMVTQSDATETSFFRSFYISRGQYLFAIRAPIDSVNNFVYYRMISNFEFLEPKNKLIGLKSKWVTDNIFEFNEGAGQLRRILNEKELSEKGYEFKDVKWYETKTTGIIPNEIKDFFPSFTISPQSLLDTNDWERYQNEIFEFLYPKEWEIEGYSSKNTLYFNVAKSRNDKLLPKLTVMFDRNPIPIETLSIMGDVKIMKFGQVESLITTMYGKEGEINPYSYLDGENNYYIEFNIDGHDYFIEFDFSGGNYNKNIQIMYTLLSSFKFIDQNGKSFPCDIPTIKDIDGNIYNTVKIGSQCWMKENLKVTKNPEGKIIICYCYDNDPNLCEIDGGLYDWNTAMDNSTQEGAQGICPDGWHIPKDSEWHVIENYLTSFNQICLSEREGWSCEPAGTKLKSEGYSGFEGILAGYRYASDLYADGLFYDRNRIGNFWSSTQSSIESDHYPWYRHLRSKVTAFGRYTGIKEYAYSVRCLKD